MRQEVFMAKRIMSNDDDGRNHARQALHKQSSVSAPAWRELGCRGATWVRLVAPAALSLGLVGCAHDGSVQQTADREVLRHGMPHEFGEHSNVTLLEVSYPPSGSSRPHRHPCPVVAYVVDGSIRMQVQGGAEHVYEAGEAFYEDPTDVHLVSANASSKTAAKFVAFFVCRDDAPLSVPVAPPVGSGAMQP
jgi:quercetin dioxygenase-like cupin family protein